MDLLIIGDVHGCYFTLKKLLKEYWNPDEMMLVQAGDLVNKGPHSAQCIKLWMRLENEHPGKVVMIRGNHEQKLINSIRRPSIFNSAGAVRNQLKKEKMRLKEVRKWLQKLPLKWENEHVLVTHAGIAKKTKDPYNLTSRNGVLYNKGPLRTLDKVQVKGHSIVEGHKPVFSPTENAWYIDTGAWTKKYLSALLLSFSGERKQVIRIPTKGEDRSVKYRFA